MPSEIQTTEFPLTHVEGNVALQPGVSHSQIMEAEAAIRMMAVPMPEAEHLFASGIYGRILEIPAGHYVSGKTHRKDHIFVVLSGDITIWTEQGTVRAGPGWCGVGVPGTKRVVYAHETTRVLNVSENPNNTRDLVQLEAEIIQPDGPLEALVSAPPPLGVLS